MKTIVTHLNEQRTKPNAVKSNHGGELSSFDNGDGTVTKSLAFNSESDANNFMSAKKGAYGLVGKFGEKYHVAKRNTSNSVKDKQSSKNSVNESHNLSDDKFIELHYKSKKTDRTWKKSSMSMNIAGLDNMKKSAKSLKKQEGWFDWKIINRGSGKDVAHMNESKDRGLFNPSADKLPAMLEHEQCLLYYVGPDQEAKIKWLPESGKRGFETIWLNKAALKDSLKYNKSECTKVKSLKSIKEDVELDDFEEMFFEDESMYESKSLEEKLFEARNGGIAWNQVKTTHGGETRSVYEAGGRVYQTYVFNTETEANSFLTKNKGYGIIGRNGYQIHVSRKSAKGRTTDKQTPDGKMSKSLNETTLRTNQDVKYQGHTAEKILKAMPGMFRSDFLNKVTDGEDVVTMIESGDVLTELFNNKARHELAKINKVRKKYKLKPLKYGLYGNK